MHDNIAIIHNHPAVAGKSLLFPFLPIFFVEVFDGGIGEGINHTVTGAGTDDKVIGKGNNILQVQQDDIFPLFILQRVYNFAGKFERIQVSPHGLVNGAENNFV